MIVGVPVESEPGERRVALVPASIAPLGKAGLEVHVEAGAGSGAGFSDAAYEEQGGRVVAERSRLFAEAGVIVAVHGGRDVERLRAGQLLIGLLDPLGTPEAMRRVAARGAVAFALELLPRISRAQPMDALTAMATIAGYKAVVLAAATLGKLFPMMITAAGTITPARVFVVGAGVAGLQAIATAHRLGAVVHAYDVRPAVKEQVESVGGRFVDMRLEVAGAEAAGGYAKAMDEDFYRRQREMMTGVVADNDVVITTAAVPGRRAPVLVTAAMIEGMRPGSVVLDLAAAGGGNCELTRPGETVVAHGVTIMGPRDLPSTVPVHASQMYARNVVAFLQNLFRDGTPRLDGDDPIIGETLVTRDGDVVHPQVRERLAGSEAAAEGRP